MTAVFAWISNRVREPSSWAAVSAGLIGLGIILNISVLVFLGIAGAAVAFILKEKGNW
jgi:hypothetical protein